MPGRPKTAKSTETLPRPLGDRYRLDERLGEGGMGVVYRGLHVQIERPVAIKLLKAEYAENDDIAERFLREARAAVKIRSEHVVEILDFGRAPDGELYFVMELLEGQPLDAVLKRARRLPPRRAVHVATQICQALGAAHQHGIVHRDLKPANVFLVERGGHPDFVKILDFGVAKLVGETESQLTRTGMMVGTVECMSPEQVLGRPVDARTDVYALGVLLYRALTGGAPFTGEGVAAVVYHHVNSPPEPLVARAPDAGIPAALDAAVLRCMAKRPEDRFASMAELAQALEEAVRDAPGDGDATRPVSFDEAPTLNVPTPAPVAAMRRSNPPGRFEAPPAPEAATIRAPTPAPLRAPTPAPLPPPGPAAEGEAPIPATDLGVIRSTGERRAPGGRRGGARRFIVAAAVGGVAIGGGAFAVAKLAGAPARDPGPPAPAPVERSAHRPVEARPAPPPPRRSPGPLTVTAAVEGAVVHAGGRRLGPAPAVIEPASFDPVDVRVEAPGHVPFEVRVEPSEEPRTVEARLFPLPPPPAAGPAKASPPPPKKPRPRGKPDEDDEWIPLR